MVRPLLLTLLWSLFGSAASAETYIHTRVFCLASGVAGPVLRSIGTDARPETDLTNLTFQNPEQSRVRFTDQIPLWSDGLYTEALLISASSILGGENRVYLGSATFTDGRGSLRELARFPALSGLQVHRPELGVRGTQLAVDETKTLIVLPSPGGQTYDLIDFRTQTKLRTILLSPLIWSNPIISMETSSVVFQKVSKTGRVLLTLWDLNTGLSTALPSSRRGTHQLSPQFVPGSILLWLEWTPEDVTLWTMNPKTRASRVVTRLPAAHSPIMAAGWAGDLTVVIPYERSSQALMIDGGLSVLKLVATTLDVRSTEIQAFPARERSRPLMAQPRLVTSLSWSPWTAEFILGKSPASGLMSWSPSESFHYIGSQNQGAHCLNPKLAPEYTGAW